MSAKSNIYNEIPVSFVDVSTNTSPSFTRGVEGTMRKNESILLKLLSLLLAGTERERAIFLWASFFCENELIG